MSFIERRLKTLIAALALCMALSMAATPALAVTTYAWSNDIGYLSDTSTPLTFKVHVEYPAALGLDADYWNLTVYSENVNATATNATYYVHIHIYDGTTNVTVNKTLACKNDQLVYANASIASATILTLVENGSAVYYVELIKPGSGTVAAYHGTVNLMTTELAAGLVSVLMIILPMIILVMIIGWVGNLTGKIGGKGRRK